MPVDSIDSSQLDAAAEQQVSVREVTPASRGQLATAVELTQRWVLRIAPIALPIAYWPLTYDHYVLPKLLLARFFVLALAVLLIARWLSTGVIAIKRSPLDFPLLAFIASALVSAAAGVNLNIGLFGTYTRYDGTLTLVTYAALYWLALQSLSDRVDAKGLLRALVAGAYLVALVAIVQWTTDAVAGQSTPRAFGTMGNANVLGAYLALLLPAAYSELRDARSIGARLLSANALTVIGLALVLSVSHSAWLGIVVAAVVLIAGRQLPAVRSRPPQIAIGIAVIALTIVVAPVALSRSTDIAQRLHIWHDSLALIASRPLLGYGPDTFGLVYPGFQTGQWVLGYLQIDKAHSELLQIAATQGLVGVAARLWVLAAVVAAFWRGRERDGAWPPFAGWAAYHTALLVNFTALAAAFPFWIFMAAAMTRWGGVAEVRFEPPRRLWSAGIGFAAIALVVALALPALVAPYFADHDLQTAVESIGSNTPYLASRPAADARIWAPQESVYATEVGNIDFEYGDYAGAREAYQVAAWLGTFNPALYRNLAMADRHLGLEVEAIAAARQAVFLDRFDPVNQAVLAQVQLGGS